MKEKFEKNGGSHDPSVKIGVEEYKSMFLELEKTINDRIRYWQDLMKKLFDDDFVKNQNIENMLTKESAQKKVKQINEYMSQFESEVNGLREMQKELTDLIKEYGEKEAEFKKALGKIAKNNLN